MLDLPARFNQDEKYYAVRTRTLAHFRRAEERELQATARNEAGPLQYSELRQAAPLDPLDRGFVGLVSRGIYNDGGDLVGDITTAAMAALGRNQQPRKYSESLADLDASWGSNVWGLRNAQGFSATQQLAVVLQSGLELLPRSTAPPIVRGECTKTREIVASSIHLSEKARSVLQRTNYKQDRSLSYNLRRDVWAMGRRMLRRRGMQVTATLLWTSLDRGDYERAYKALGILLRSDGIVMRSLWMPAVELLAWDQSRSDTRSSRTPTAFLDWLIVNFPTVSNNAALWRKIPRAENFRPLAIVSRLVDGDYRGAMEKAEEAMLTIPSSVDPLCWALAGLAALKIEDATGELRSDDARKYFRRCMELGGVLPRKLVKPSGLEMPFTKNEDGSPATNFLSETAADSGFESDSGSDALDGPVEKQESGSGSRSWSSASEMNSESDSSSDEYQPETPNRVKRETDYANTNNAVSLAGLSAIKHEVRQVDSVSSERASQSSLGASWNDFSNSEEDEFAGEAEIKREASSQITQGGFSQSQGSTLGASWTDSESEDEC